MKSPEFWQNIIYRQYRLPEDYTLNELTVELVGHLGSPDPEYRDEYAYMILANWIYKGVYQSHQLNALLDQMQQNLQRGLGEYGTDSVFLRSFSMLILGAIIERDNQAPFLKVSDVRRVLDDVVLYLANEEDMRGFIMDKGWAHAMAHTADTLLYLSQSQHIGGPQLEMMLAAISSKLTQPTGYIYQHDEDERLAVATIGIMERNLVSMPVYQQWLGELVAGLKSPLGDPVMNVVYQNIKNYLRSLYVQLILMPRPTESMRNLRHQVLIAIQHGHRYAK